MSRINFKGEKESQKNRAIHLKIKEIIKIICTYKVCFEMTGILFEREGEADVKNDSVKVRGAIGT